jgi:hypothetical protein
LADNHDRDSNQPDPLAEQLGDEPQVQVAGRQLSGSMLLQYEAESEQHCRDDGHGNVHDLRLPASWPIKRRPSSLDQHSIAALGQ